ncbi:MAG: hypothetical protein JNJ46_21015 [Myxococcales bacterium]|nr:hypothetical protein [Myxococcales bacterium]
MQKLTNAIEVASIVLAAQKSQRGIVQKLSRRCVGLVSLGGCDGVIRRGSIGLLCHCFDPVDKPLSLTRLHRSPPRLVDPLYRRIGRFVWVLLPPRSPRSLGPLGKRLSAQPAAAAQTA